MMFFIGRTDMIFFEHIMTCFWLIVSVIALFIELLNIGLFFFLSFFIGGIVAAIVSPLFPSIIVQTIIFLVATVVASIILRYYLVPFIEKNRPHERTNVHAMVGKRGFVIVSTDDKELGIAKINGRTWAARCIQGEKVLIGDEIEVVDVKGTHVIVKNISIGA